MIVFGKRLKPHTELPVIENIKHRFKHLYMIGKPGMGKSSLLERLIQQDLDSGNSVIFIDPKGDSVRKLKANNPEKDIIYIDFNNNYIGLNPLTRKGYSLDVIASEFSDIVNVMTSETSSNVELTVRMKTILTNLIKGVDKENLNIQFFIRFLGDHTKMINKINSTNDEVIAFWKSLSKIDNVNRDKVQKVTLTMQSISERLQMFLIDSRMNKFLTSGDFVVDDMVNRNQSLFVDISSGVSESKKFLANLIVYSVISYTHQKKNDKPLFVYVDEFQYCASKAFANALRICRSKNIGFIMAHQDFEAISPDLVSAILSVVDNYVVFRVGMIEAEMLARFMGVKPEDIFNQAEFNALFRSGTINTSFYTLPPLEYKFPFEETEPIEEPIIEEPIKTSYHFLSDDWM